MYRPLILFFAIFITFTPVSAEIILFSPASNSVSTSDVRDITNGPDNSVIFATTNGISYYDGSWRISHMDWLPDHKGQMDDFVVAVEYDNNNNLWIGYAGGLQIFDGETYTTITDQQLLKNRIINDIQAWKNEMWISTGNAGVHRVVDGEWKWFQPFEEGGLDCYIVNDIAIDYNTGSVIVVSKKYGGFICSNINNSLTFRQIGKSQNALKGMTGVVSNPPGGVYFFNSTDIVQYHTLTGITPILNINDLPAGTHRIYDISVTKDGKIIIGTDFGISCWKNGELVLHHDRASGLGNNIVQKVFVDNAGRWWFANKGYVGYYYDNKNVPVIPVSYVDYDTKSESNGERSPDTSVSELPHGVRDENSDTVLSSDNGENNKDSLLENLKFFIDSVFNLLPL